MTDIADELRAMAASGMTRKAMSAATGLNTGPLNHILRTYGIKTCGKRGVVAKPKVETVPIHGVSGQPPAKLMPSPEAVRAASIWRLV